MKKIHKKIIALQAAKFDAMAKHTIAPRWACTVRVTDGKPSGRKHKLFSKSERLEINARQKNGRTPVDAVRRIEKMCAGKRASVFRAYACRYERNGCSQESIDNWIGSHYAFKSFCMWCVAPSDSPLVKRVVARQLASDKYNPPSEGSRRHKVSPLRQIN